MASETFDSEPLNFFFFGCLVYSCPAQCCHAGESTEIQKHLSKSSLKIFYHLCKIFCLEHIGYNVHIEKICAKNCSQIGSLEVYFEDDFILESSYSYDRAQMCEGTHHRPVFR